jgi:hypothetical protein
MPRQTIARASLSLSAVYRPGVGKLHQSCRSRRSRSPEKWGEDGPVVREYSPLPDTSASCRVQQKYQVTAPRATKKYGRRAEYLHITGRMACRPDALRGRRSLRDVYTPSVGAPFGRDQYSYRPTGGPRRSRYTCYEVTAARVGRTFRRKKYSSYPSLLCRLPFADRPDNPALCSSHASCWR